MVRRVPRRSRCGRKVRFPDEYEAGRTLTWARQTAERTGTPTPLRWYYHSRCGGFHLTSRLFEEESKT